MKTCSKCGIEKPKSDFHKQLKGKGGLYSQCKECTKAASKIYYDAHREEMKEKSRKYREKYPEKVHEANQRWIKENPQKASESKQRTRDKHKEQRHEYNLAYQQENREVLIERSRQKYRADPEKYRKKSSKWAKNNREKANQMRATYMSNPDNRERVQKITSKQRKIRRKSDPTYKLITTVRSTINRAIMRNSKGGRAIKLLGCSICELKKYLEAQFKPGMSWDNWSQDGWHIDHIIPISFFDLADEAQQKRCFKFTNLQPLWAKENLSKGGINRSGMTKEEILESMAF